MINSTKENKLQLLEGCKWLTVPSLPYDSLALVGQRMLVHGGWFWALIITSLLSSCMLLYPAGQEDTCGTYQANDTLRYDFTFYPSGKVKSIEKYVKQHDWWSRNGYQYTFHDNGRLKAIRHFDKGGFSSFAIRQNRKGDIVKIMTKDGQSAIETIKSIVDNPANKGRGGINTMTGRSPNGNMRVKYEISTGEITSIEEYDDEPTGPNRYRIFKSGIYVLLHKGTINDVWQYQVDVRIGENLIFNKMGKLQKFYYKGPDGLGLAYKVKDLQEVVSAKPCKSN